MEEIRNWYDRSYKWMLLFPALLLLLSLVYLVQFNAVHGDIITKDVSLTGGTTVSVFDGRADIDEVRDALKKEFSDVIVRGISDIRTGKQHGFFVESRADADTLKAALEKHLEYQLTNENSSVEFSGATLSVGFYQQLRNAVVAAFLLMGWIVFFIFSSSREMKAYATMLTFVGVKVLLSGIAMINVLALAGIVFGLLFGIFQKGTKNILLLLIVFAFSVASFFVTYPVWISLLIGGVLVVFYTLTSVPSIAVILAAFADIVMTVVVVDLLGMQLSTAGIIAFLMLIGYSVDTDILLTSRLLRSSEGSVNARILGAFKTGMTMTITAIAAVGVSFIIIYNFSDTLQQIFGIILIGLCFDIINTWITNASLLKWYLEVRKT